MRREEAQAGLTLVESRSPLEPEPGAVPSRRSEILLDGVAGVSLRYFGSTAENAPPARAAMHRACLRIAAVVNAGAASP